MAMQQNSQKEGRSSQDVLKIQTSHNVNYDACIAKTNPKARPYSRDTEKRLILLMKGAIYK